MKKLTLLSLFTLAIFTTQAALSVSTVSEPVPGYLQVKNFIHMSVADFQAASGQKLGFLQKIYFKKLQKNLKKAALSPDATILAFYDVQKKKFRFDSLWFVLGCIIGPFALLFAYTSKQPRNKRLSALIGFGVFVLWFGWLFLF